MTCHCLSWLIIFVIIVNMFFSNLTYHKDKILFEDFSAKIFSWKSARTKGPICQWMIRKNKLVILQFLNSVALFETEISFIVTILSWCLSSHGARSLLFRLIWGRFSSNQCWFKVEALLFAEESSLNVEYRVKTVDVVCWKNLTWNWDQFYAEFFEQINLTENLVKFKLIWCSNFDMKVDFGLSGHQYVWRIKTFNCL